MSFDKSFQEIDSTKNRIIDKILVFGSTLSVITYLASFVDYKNLGFQYTYITDLIVITVFVLFAIYRKKFSIKVKSLIIMIGLFTLVLTDTIKWSILSDNKVLLVLIPFFAFLGYDFKRSIIFFILSVIGIATVGYLQITGHIIVAEDFAHRVVTVGPWIINFLILTIVSFVVIIIVSQFNNTFLTLLNNLKNKNIEIAQKEQNYREIFNSSTDAIFIHDLKGEVIDVNDAMLSMYGYNKDEICKMDISNISWGEGKYSEEQSKKHVITAIQKGKHVFDWHAKKKTGELFWVEVALKKTNILGDERILAFVRDIDDKKKTALQLENYRNGLEELVEERTRELKDVNEDLQATNEELHIHRSELQNTLDKLKRTQEKLIHSEKMASLGTLSAGVSHEINNPLNFIQGGLFGLTGFFNDNPLIKTDETNHFLDAIDEGVNRAADIVLSLNHFSQKDTSKMESCNVHEIIDNCLVVLHNQIKNRITVVKNYADSELHVMGNDGNLHQAILNILTNAEQAINTTGTINIDTEEVNNNIKISITDDGIGIKKEHMLQVTEPFFTTKDPGVGTGLGLSIAYNVFKDHGGSFEIRSEQNIGTVVIIKLPIITNSI